MPKKLLILLTLILLFVSFSIITFQKDKIKNAFSNKVYIAVEKGKEIEGYFSVIEMDSMAPTIPQGGGFKLFALNSFFDQYFPQLKHELKRGDIISFSNAKTQELINLSGRSPYNFVKRIVGMPGASVEIKGGIVFINDKPLDEPYTKDQNNTYIPSEEVELSGVKIIPFMKECQKITVPKGSYLVLGDNRENSDDSRYIGFVNQEDIEMYLSWEDQQKEYYHGVNRIKHNENWRSESSLTNEIINNAINSCK